MRWTIWRSVSMLSTRQATESSRSIPDYLKVTEYADREAAEADAHLADAVGVGRAQLLEFGAAQPQHLGRGCLLARARTIVLHLACQGILVLGQTADFGPLAGPDKDDGACQQQGIEQQIAVHGGCFPQR